MLANVCIPAPGANNLALEMESKMLDTEKGYCRFGDNFSLSLALCRPFKNLTP